VRITGYTVVLELRDGFVTIAERLGQHRKSVSLSLPVTATLQAELVASGRALRLVLETPFGAMQGESVRVSMLFDIGREAELNQFVSALAGGAGESVTDLLFDFAMPAMPLAASPSVLPRLRVVRVPDHPEWLSFQPLPSATEVLDFGF
jgi:hypothetical protein